MAAKFFGGLVDEIRCSLVPYFGLRFEEFNNHVHRLPYRDADGRTKHFDPH